MPNPIKAGPPPGPRDVSSAREGRNRALFLGATSGVAARIVSVGCTLATVPIALQHLGAEGYGLWMTVASVAALLGLLDFGVGLGARNLLAQAHGRNDGPDLQALWAAAFRRLALVGLIFAVLAVPAAQLLDWPAIFNVSTPTLATHLPTGLTVLAVGVAVALPVSLAPSFAAALQRPWLAHLATGTGGVLLLAAVLLASQTGAAWPVWVGIMVGLPVLINGAMAVYLHRQLGWPLRSILSAGEWRPELRTLSFWFFVPQAGSLFALAAPPMLIALLASPEAVATFNLLQRIFGLLGQVHWMVVAAWWPAYAVAQAQGDFSWVRTSHRWSWWVTLGVFVPAVLAAALVTPGLIELWVGSAAPRPEPRLIWFMAAWQVCQLVGQPPALLLNGLSRIRAMAIYSSLGHVASVAAMIWLGSRHGPAGVIMGMMLGYAVVGLPCVLLDAALQLRKLGRE